MKQNLGECVDFRHQKCAKQPQNETKTMTEYYFIEFSIKLSEEPDSLLPIYVIGSIDQSLKTFFGEIGGTFDWDLLDFDGDRKRGVLKVYDRHYTKLRAALTVISQFQSIPCHFRVHKADRNLIILNIS